MRYDPGMGDARRRKDAGLGRRDVSDLGSRAARDRREAARRSSLEAEKAAALEREKDQSVVRAAITLKQAVNAAKARRAFLDAAGDEAIGPELRRAIEEGR